MIIEKEAFGTESAHKIEIYCPNCGRDVDETELTNKVCNDCGQDLSNPKQHVSVLATSMRLGVELK